MTNRKKKLIFGVGAALLVLMMAAAGVYAWYMSLTTNLIDPQTLSVTTSQYLEVRRADAADGDEAGEFGNVLVLDYGEELELVDITGDGAVLVRPLLNQDTDQTTGTSIASPDVNNDWYIPTPNVDYIDVPLEFRSNKQLAVFLGEGSAVTPNEEVLFGEGVTNKSNYGDFSRDLIAAAARVAFVDETGSTPATRLVWEPNRYYMLYYNEGWGFTIPTEAAPGTEETPHYYWYTANSDGSGTKTRSTLESVSGLSIAYDEDIEQNTTTISYPNEDGAKALVVRLTQSESDGLYYGRVTLRIWIEGCDREARRALAGGEIDVKLYFYGYEYQSQGE